MIDLKTDTELLADGTYVVSVAGGLDHDMAPLLEQELEEAFGSGARSVIVDLTACEFIDSTALTILVDANKQLKRSGGGLSLVTTDRNVRRILEIVGLASVFVTHACRATAMAGVSPAGLRPFVPRLVGGSDPIVTEPAPVCRPVRHAAPGSG